MSELCGIIKNALEHGWPIPEIRESLINSGYNLSDIEAEIGKFSQLSKQSPPINPLPIFSQRSDSTWEEKKTTSLQEYQLPKVPEKKHTSLKTFLIILTILFFGFLSIVVYAFITSLLEVV